MTENIPGRDCSQGTFCYDKFGTFLRSYQEHDRYLYTGSLVKMTLRQQEKNRKIVQVKDNKYMFYCYFSFS